MDTGWLLGHMLGFFELFKSEKKKMRFKEQIAAAKKNSDRHPLYDQYGELNLDYYEDITALEDAFENYIEFLEKQKDQLNTVIIILIILMIIFFALNFNSH